MEREPRFLSQIWSRVKALPETRQRGQVLIIVVLAIFGLLAAVGLGVDLGLFYIERVRITRAVDAAALAAAAELPVEPAAHQRALEFLRENGYDFTDPSTRVVVNGTYVSGPEADQATTIIELDTASFRDPELPPEQQEESAFRIRVKVIRRVPVVFLQFIGFRTLDAEAAATAENINNLDIVIVFDRSGSMEFDTLCYGCWEPAAGIPYPGGVLHPLPWDGPADGPPAHCGPTQRYRYGGYDYYFIEAEEYSYATPSYARYQYTPYQTYWVLQRESGDRASGRDGRGAYIMHMPFPDYETSSGYGVTCRYSDIANGGWCNSNVPGGPFPAPRVDYDFSPLYDGYYYIWVRGQAPSTWARGDGLDRRLYWGLNGGLQGYESNFRQGTGYNGANPYRWQWRRLNNTGIYMQHGQNYTLNLWAGGAEFAVDRIAITNYPYGSDGNPPSPMNANSGRGVYHWANGRTGWACEPCDARFGGHPGQSGYRDYEPNCDYGPNPDRRYDDIYDDEQPIRTAIEAAKRFVGMLDSRYDQIGYVRYSSDPHIASELQCLRRCSQRPWECPSGECTPEVITDTVIAALDATYAGGATNIAGGMQEGIRVLSTQSGHYGRPGAAHVMIVMTDGRANRYPNNECWQEDLWPDNSGSTSEVRGRDCVIYYAQQARDNSIVVYTITLGGSADFELMEAVADMTGGVHRNADRPEKLNEIFDELYERIFLRLVE